MNDTSPMFFVALLSVLTAILVYQVLGVPGVALYLAVKLGFLMLTKSNDED